MSARVLQLVSIWIGVKLVWIQNCFSSPRLVAQPTLKNPVCFVIHTQQDKEQMDPYRKQPHLGLEPVSLIRFPTAVTVTLSVVLNNKYLETVFNQTEVVYSGFSTPQHTQKPQTASVIWGHKKQNKSYTSVLDLTLNCIWWWGSSSGELRRVEYSFIVITLMSTLTRSGRTSLHPLYGSKRSIWKMIRLWYTIQQCAKDLYYIAILDIM